MSKLHKYFEFLVGNPKKEFSFKIIPGLLSDAKNANNTEMQFEDRGKLSTTEYQNRYRNLQRAYYIIAALAAFSLLQAYFSEAYINKLGALLASVLMSLYLLKFSFRMWAARLVYSVGVSSQSNVATIRFTHYVQQCLSNPKNLLPISLPKDAK